MRVGLLTQYYAPEVGAPQTRLRATARLLSERGHRVDVVTCAPHYPTGRVAPGYVAMSVKREVDGAVGIVRLPVIARPNSGFMNRVLDQASFAVFAMATAPLVRRWDVALIESPPLFLGATARVLRALTHRPYVLHIADPWPDFPIALGALRGWAPIAAARWLERKAYAGASVVTTVTETLVQRLDGNESARGKVRLLPNGVDLERFDPTAPAHEARRELGWPEATLTLAYIGTIGLAQGLRTLIEAVGPLADRGVVAHVVGEGVERQDLERLVASRAIQNVLFHDPVPSASVPRVLAAADASIVLLRRGPLYEEALPTKLVEAMAAGRPVILSGAGEAAAIVSGARAGLVAEPGSEEALRAELERFLKLRDRGAMGTRARTMAEKTFDRRHIVERLEHYLSEAARSVSR